MFRKAVVFTALLFFVAGQMAYAAAPELNIAGQVRGAGTADKCFGQILSGGQWGRACDGEQWRHDDNAEKRRAPGAWQEL